MIFIEGRVDAWDAELKYTNCIHSTPITVSLCLLYNSSRESIVCCKRPHRLYTEQLNGYYFCLQYISIDYPGWGRHIDSCWLATTLIHTRKEPIENDFLYKFNDTI